MRARASTFNIISAACLLRLPRLLRLPVSAAGGGCLCSKPSAPNTKQKSPWRGTPTGSLFGAEDGTFPRANQQSTGLLVPALRCRRPVPVLSSEYQTKIPMAGYAMGTFVWCGRWDLNPHVIDTRTSNVPVCRFQHFRKSHLTARKILAHLGV